ncbi:hypothetical protein HZB03_05670 [Candidatus Woesearchaeota archaeon]|nr:hypothetical protein [Candidatus Woesearchaeota archaeon]
MYALGVGISPSVLTIEHAFRNHSYGREIVLMNPNDEDVSFVVIRETKGNILISTEPEQGIIPAREKMTLNVLITVPSHLPDGVYEDVLLAQIRPAGPDKVTVTPSLAIPVRTVIEGKQDSALIDDEKALYEDNEISEENVSDEINAFDEAIDHSENKTGVVQQDKKEEDVIGKVEELESKQSVQEPTNRLGIVGEASAFLKKQELSLIDFGVFVVFLGMLAVFTIITLRGDAKPCARKKRRK